MRALHQARGPVVWLLVADLTALIVFAVALGVAVAEGARSGALIVGVPPLVLAILTSLAFVAAEALEAKMPLIIAIALCGIGILGATTSFITPLMASTVPVGSLLIAACAIKLDTAQITPRAR